MDKNILQRNKTAWNEAFGYHKKARGNTLQKSFQNPTFTTFNEADKKAGVLDRITQLNLLGKKIAHMQTNNGRELISIMRYTNASEGVGFDISNEAIAEANELAKIANVNAKFICTNILEIDKKYNNYFDSIIITEGSLSWIENIEAYFATMSRLLKTSGSILICEIHPIAFLLDDCHEPQMDYDKTEPCRLKTSLDYVGGIEYEPLPCYNYMHKISTIIMSLINNNFQIKYFNETKQDTGWMDPDNKNTKFPLSFQLIATKTK